MLIKWIDRPTIINEIDHLFNSIKFALEDLNKMRKIEGANLGNDLIKRIELLSLYLSKIDSEIKISLKENLDKNKLKLESIVNETNLDENRLLQEVVILLEKKDITEEIVRLKSHFDLFLDFLGQEQDFLDWI